MTKGTMAAGAIAMFIIGFGGTMYGYHLGENSTEPEVKLVEVLGAPAEPCSVFAPPETVLVAAKLTPEEIINLLPRTVAWSELAEKNRQGGPYFGVTVEEEEHKP